MLKSVQTLLSSIVDYAGLFPPAKLGMQEAMANYAQHQNSPQNWMLARFVLPITRLEEFKTLAPLFSSTGWSLSIILAADMKVAIADTLVDQLNQIQSIQSPEITVTALELPPLNASELEKIASHLPSALEVFAEIPLSENLEEYLAVLRSTGMAAKVRTGGITVNAFPEPAQLAQFILSCAAKGVPLKATAGLHHPLPGKHPVTYEPNAPLAWMQGFLNVAILAALACQQMASLEAAIDLLGTETISDFDFTAQGLSWKNKVLDLLTLESTRQHCFRSFGSCSFQEPVDDLRALGLI